MRDYTLFGVLCAYNIDGAFTSFISLFAQQGLVFSAMEATAGSRLVVAHRKCKSRTSSGEMITLPRQKKRGGVVLMLLQFYDAETN